MKKTFVSLIFIILFSSASYADILGAGATFPYPLYSKLFKLYNKETNTRVNYQAIGSGGGTRQLKNTLVDFAASDVFLSAENSVSQNPILHIPICSGGVAVSFNLPGISTLNLDASTLGSIFMGKITKWNDPQIKQLNQNANLPAIDIVTVQRSDSSGTTYIFSDFLNDAFPTWSQKMGVGKSLNWPVGISSKGNAGISGLLKQIPGSIGYVTSVYAIQNKLSVASIKNSSGNFVLPNIEAIKKSSQVIIPDDAKINLNNTKNPEGYPISGFTWILVYENQNYNEKTSEESAELFSL